MSRRKNYGAMMIAAMCLGIFMPNVAQYQLSPFAPTIMSELGISASQFSALFTAPMIPAVILSLVAGVLVDRFNPKLVVAISMAITIAGSVTSVFAGSYTHLLAAFIMIGVSAAVLNCTQAKLVSGWYSPEKVPGKIGIILSASTIAMTVALATTALFPSRTIAFTITAILSALALVLWLVLYKTPPKSSVSVNGMPPQDSILDGLRVVVKNKSIWVITFCLFFIMATNVVMGSFMPTILGARSIDPVTAGYYSSIYMIGCFLSCYIAPLFARQLKSIKGAVVVFAVLSFVGVSFSAAYVPEGIALGAAILLTGIAVGGSIPLLMSLPVGTCGIGPRFAGTAGGFIATIQLIGAIVVPSYVLIPIAGENNYSTLFLLGGICMLLCAALALLLPKGK